MVQGQWWLEQNTKMTGTLPLSGVAIGIVQTDRYTIGNVT